MIKPSGRALEQMGDFVRMHEASGLLRLLDSGLSLAEAEQRVLDYVRAFVADPGKAPLAGNTIGTDRAFLAGTCRPSSGTFTIAVSMFPASRSWYAVGTHGSTTKRRPRRAIISARRRGVHRGAAVLPRGGVRATAWP